VESRAVNGKTSEPLCLPVAAVMLAGRGWGDAARRKEGV